MKSDMPLTLEILQGICTTTRTENTAQWSVTFIITYLYTIIEFVSESYIFMDNSIFRAPLSHA